MFIMFMIINITNNGALRKELPADRVPGSAPFT